jgi:hypothetical protein
MGQPRSALGSVDLVRVLELLRTHITAALYQTVFAAVRITERQRPWTLEALVEFWLAVLLRAPRALVQALYEMLEGSEPLFPLVQATPEAFVQRCRPPRPAFFAAIFAWFTARLLPATPARYAADLCVRPRQEIPDDRLRHRTIGQETSGDRVPEEPRHGLRLGRREEGEQRTFRAEEP